MRFREIWEYLQKTPGNTNKSILKQMVDNYMTDSQNGLADYTIDAAIADSVDLLGKKASDLQKNIVIDDGKVTGMLKYVTGYTQFGAPEEQQGYYLVLHFEHDDADTIKVGGVTLDSDGLHIIRIQNPVKKSNRKIKVELEDESESLTYVDYLDLSELDFE